jgi:hypothetical protein
MVAAVGLSGDGVRISRVPSMWVTWASRYMPVSAGVWGARCEGSVRRRGAGIVTATNAGAEGVLLRAAPVAKAISSEAVAGRRARPLTLHVLKLNYESGNWY